MKEILPGEAWLIADILTLDGEKIGDGSVKLGIHGTKGTFEPRRPINVSRFLSEKFLVVQIDSLQIETTDWKMCHGSDDCRGGTHFHFPSPN